MGNHDEAQDVFVRDAIENLRLLGHDVEEDPAKGYRIHQPARPGFQNDREALIAALREKLDEQLKLNEQLNEQLVELLNVKAPQ